MTYRCIFPVCSDSCSLCSEAVEKLSTYEEVVQAFEAWATRNDFDPKDLDLKAAFLGGVEMIEKRLFPDLVEA